MSDYISEAEAMADWEDDNCIVDDEFYPYYPTPRYYRKSSKRKSYVPRDKAGRKKELSAQIECIRTENQTKKKGDSCTCPICKTSFIKASYQQVFCSSSCHNKYHKLRYQ